MFRSLGFSVLTVVLAALALAALPILPTGETASVKLKTEPTEETGRLLGENRATLAPEGARKPVARGGSSGAMTLSVPRLGIENVSVPTGSTQKELDREGVIHLAGTGVPWREGSNTFIVGHALGFMHTRVPYVFYELNKLRPGDEIIVRDTDNREYVFRVYDRMTVRPADYWVTHPVEGKTTISLQSCTPVPTFENRLVVRGELVS